MRCVLTVNFSPWSRYSGGGQRSTHNLARALAKRGHRVTVVYTKPPWEDVPVPTELPYEIVWAALPGARRTTPFFVAAAVKRLVDEARAEATVVHGQGEEAALLPELRRGRAARSFAFVMTPRYPNFPDVLLREPSARSRLALLAMSVVKTKYIWLGRALRGADWICPTSRSAAEMVERAYGLESTRITTVPNGISDEFLKHASTALPDDPALAAFVERGPFAIYFGRLSIEKGVHTVLDALGGDATLTTRVVFAGRGPALSELEARVRREGLSERVLFSTWLDAAQLAALVSRASFAILPSLEESFGNTMAEAMALGVPVLSTTAGSIPELIAHGVSGLLVPPGDAAALARAIRDLSGDPALRARFATAGRTYAHDNLTWDASAARFERLYERLVAR
jgi:glycosyltransferase involved in cell wall biosynthesis